MSIQSMLTGNTKNERPQGDAEFVRSMGGAGGFGGRRLKDVPFVYDDNTVKNCQWVPTILEEQREHIKTIP